MSERLLIYKKMWLWPVSYEGTELKEWQKTIMEIVEGDIHPRKIIVIYDKEGNSGKTYLSRYLAATMGALVVANGKTADIAYIYNGERIVVFDIARSLQDHINWGDIEQIKNGMVFSPKYESKCKNFDQPHVPVMTNTYPDKKMLSKDRWSVVEIFK